MTAKEYNDSVDRYADGLYRFAMRLMDNAVVAEDLVQESFTRLWEKRDTVKAASARSYLFTILYNAAVDMMRTAKKQVCVEEAHSHSYEHRPDFDIQEHINRGLALLPETQRTAILLRDYEGYSYAEIGEIANLSETQVKVYIHRARQFLRNYLGEIDNLL
jgi:RNA polymerase sigma factor, sigma-70 family